MSMADYNPGGTFGSTPSLFEGQCAEKCVCSALDRGLPAITQALYKIDATLGEKNDKACEVVDKCKQEIIDVIDQRFRGTQRSCEACQADAQAGLAGTLDYAIACAGACISDVQERCPDGSTPPCDEPPKPKRYVGLCNRLTGDCSVIREGATSLDPLASPVALADTEAAALAMACEFCSHYFIPIDTTPEPQKLQSTGSTIDRCQISGYMNGSIANTIFSTGDTTFRVAGVAKVLRSVGQSGIDGINFDNLGRTISGIYEAVVGSAPAIAELVLPAMATALGCTDGTWISGLEVIAAIGMVEQQTGINLQEYATSINYVVNAACRRRFLPPDQATTVYLAGGMSLEDYDAHFAIAGFCPEAATQRLYANKSRPGVADAIKMRHRRHITPQQYTAMMRELGFVDQVYSDQIFAASFNVPGPATLIAMQQQGVMDEGEANKHSLDAHSEALYTGALGEYFDANGVTHRERQLLWRTHWANPSVSDLYRFVQRSRVDVNFGTRDEREADLNNGLTQLGIDDYFRPLYIAAAFDPLTKRDIASAYADGVIADDELFDHLRQTAYDENAISVIARELQINRRKHASGHIAIVKWLEQHNSQASVVDEMTRDGYSPETINQAMADVEYKLEASSWALSYARGMMTRERLTGYLTQHGVTDVGANAIATKLSFRITDHRSVKEYAAGTVTHDGAVGQMQTDGLATETINSLLNFADDTIRADTANACASGLRSRYLTGELDRDEVRNELIRFGVALPRANQLVSSFDCAKSAQGKHVPVEKLCHWLYLGAISQPDFLDRLHNLGYSEIDAALLLQDCVQANTLRSIKEANKVAKELQSAADKQQRAIKRAQDAIDAANKRTANARKAKATLRAARDKQLLSSAERLSNSVAVDLVTAMGSVREALRAAQETYGLQTDEALKIIVLASENMKGEDISAYVPYANQLSREAAASGLEPTNADIGLPPSTNGSTQPSP